MDIPEDESEIMNQIRFRLPTFIGQRYGHAPAELSHLILTTGAQPSRSKSEC